MILLEKNFNSISYKLIYFVFISLHFISLGFCQTSENDQDFDPTVTARCERGIMNIAVVTKQPFYGLIHTRDFRRAPCLTTGKGELNSSLSISLIARPDEPNFCGVYKLKGSEERTVALTVRVHKTLELSDDKYFIITCSQSGFRNARNELSRVSLKLLDKGLKVVRLTHGNQYTLRAEISSPNEDYNISVRNCFSFVANTSEVELIDGNGCPKLGLISGFTYNQSHSAEATIYSMFKFPDVNKIHFQCDIILCKVNCPPLQCNSDNIKNNNNNNNNEDFRLSKDSIQLMASTTVFVVEPGAEISASYLQECTEWRFPWLIALCIMLAIMLLIMLLVNIFLCSSMSCSCIKSEVEREDSEIEEYDPYKIDWIPSSHYGSRTSLNKNGYTSGGGSTINSHRSYSGNESDPYSPVTHSRPNSRFSNKPSQMTNSSQTYVKY